VTMSTFDGGIIREQLRSLVPDFAREDARTSPKQRPSPYPAHPTPVMPQPRIIG